MPYNSGSAVTELALSRALRSPVPQQQADKQALGRSIALWNPAAARAAAGRTSVNARVVSWFSKMGASSCCAPRTCGQLQTSMTVLETTVIGDLDNCVKETT